MCRLQFTSNSSWLLYTADLRLDTNVSVLHMPLYVYSGHLTVASATHTGTTSRVTTCSMFASFNVCVCC